MRNFLSLALAFFIIMASIPTVSLFYKDEILTKSEASAAAAGQAVQESDEAPAAGEKSEEETDADTGAAQTAAASAAIADKVRVLLHKEDKVLSVSTEFYLISVLAKEIDIAAPTEALKAQAVCIYTFLMHSRQESEAQDYDITDDPAHHQSFLSEKALQKFWGENYEKNYEKLQKIVRSVSGLYLDYEGKAALAAYHSSNAGMTESAENYWGEAYPYLRAVESIGDCLSSAYKNSLTFKPEELKEALSSLKDKSFSFPKSPSDWIGAVQTTPSQTVTSIEIGGAVLSGRELREVLKLPSSFFTVEYKNKQFVFTVSGYGHGVGMSQEGAKYMAELGFSFRQILLHYYNGVAIKGENGV